jgi:hypothetical protein
MTAESKMDQLKPHRIFRSAELLTDHKKIKEDILKLRSAAFETKVWDAIGGEYAPLPDVYFTRTTDERASEILRAGLIGDLEIRLSDIESELTDLNLPAAVEQIQPVLNPTVKLEPEAMAAA